MAGKAGTARIERRAPHGSGIAWALLLASGSWVVTWMLM